MRIYPTIPLDQIVLDNKAMILPNRCCNPSIIYQSIYRSFRSATDCTCDATDPVAGSLSNARA